MRTISTNHSLLGRYGLSWRFPVEPPAMARFTVLKRRWVVERTIAWIGRNRRMSKDYEFLTETSESFTYAAMSRLVLKRLVKGVEKQKF